MSLAAPSHSAAIDRRDRRRRRIGQRQAAAVKTRSRLMSATTEGPRQPTSTSRSARPLRYRRDEGRLGSLGIERGQQINDHRRQAPASWERPKVVQSAPTKS